MDATVLMGVGWMNYRDPTARSLAVRAQLPVSEAPASRALALQSIAQWIQLGPFHLAIRAILCAIFVISRA